MPHEPRPATTAAPATAPPRLVWPGLDGPPPPWLRACAALLGSRAEQISEGPARQPGGASAGTAEPATQNASAAAVALCLDVGAAAGLGAQRCWLLTDAAGRPLNPRRPLLADITRAQGIALALWQRCSPAEPWVCIRRLHVTAPARYARSLQLLPAALARLLQQAITDLQLGAAAVGLGSKGPGPGAAGAAPSDSPLWAALRGGWTDWIAVQRSRWTREHWRIGVIDAPLPRLLAPGALPAVRWLEAPSDSSRSAPGGGPVAAGGGARSESARGSHSHGYWADPMGGGPQADEIYCEYFNEHSGQGHIERLRLSPQGRVSERTRLPLGGGRHVSFPLVMQFEGQRLGLVETAALQECVLYTVDAAGHWRPMATLLQGKAVADPALFFSDARWWLAYTDIGLGEADNLCLQYAPALTGPWQPHANNPVRVDVRGARMAGGFFWHEGALYRPAQDCLATYGAAIQLQRVLRCTPTEYEEETVRVLRPDPKGMFPDGLHTLSAWGERTLVDGKRHRFSLLVLWLKLRRRLGLLRQTPEPAYPPTSRR